MDRPEQTTDEDQKLIREMLRNPIVFREELAKMSIDRWFQGYRLGFITALMIAIIMFLITK